MSFVRGCHKYKLSWKLFLRKQFETAMEPEKAVDKYEISEIYHDTVVGHLLIRRIERFVKLIFCFFQTVVLNGNFCLLEKKLN